MIVLSNHPNSAKLEAIEKASKKVTHIRDYYNSFENWLLPKSKFKVHKAILILNKLDSDYLKLLYYTK